MSLFSRLLSLGIVFSALTAGAMDSEKIRVAVWKKGESIAGEDFIAGTEAVVDYLATLKRPTDPLKAIRYNCMVKGRRVRPSVQSTQFNSARSWAEVITIYEIKDCVEAP